MSRLKMSKDTKQCPRCKIYCDYAETACNNCRFNFRICPQCDNNCDFDDKICFRCGSRLQVYYYVDCSTCLA